MAVLHPKTRVIRHINATGHDPGETLDYAISFEDTLRTGEVVASVSWECYDSGGLVTNNAPFEVHALTAITPQAATVEEGDNTYLDCEVVWLNVEGVDAAAKNARIGETGVITLIATTNQNRIYQRSFALRVTAN